MPVWTLTEIMECREYIYPSLPKEVVTDCYKRWGGIPHYVLRYVTNQDKQHNLDEAIQAVNLDVLLTSVRKTDVKDQTISHHVLHLLVDDIFKPIHYEFASEAKVVHDTCGDCPMKAANDGELLSASPFRKLNLSSPILHEPTQSVHPPAWDGSLAANTNTLLSELMKNVASLEKYLVEVNSSKIAIGPTIVRPAMARQAPSADG
ncbi:unnamed protein product [Phytophthora lilii]|uniref:Unnamed protein product n=1 Tax=Phytophthora lilii TaxID=2077276 RepID=A0A9W6X442_9STRA|nr:unnamed protein product [Phytophthora lilii]